MSLASEIADDPLGRGYAGMTDKQVADSLNARDRPKEGVDAAGLVTLSADGTLAEVEVVRNSLYDASEIESAVATILSGNLKSLPNVLTRAEEIGLAPVKEGHVGIVRK